MKYTIIAVFSLVVILHYRGHSQSYNLGNAIYFEVAGTNLFSLNYISTSETSDPNWSLSYRVGGFYIPWTIAHSFGLNAGVSFLHDKGRKRKPELGISACYNSIFSWAPSFSASLQIGWRFDFEKTFLKLNLSPHILLTPKYDAFTPIVPMIGVGIGLKTAN